MKTDGGGPAFPAFSGEGMTLRQWYAGMAMQCLGPLSLFPTSVDAKNVRKAADMYATAMLSWDLYETDDAPGPSVHHDETHGYHTADGEPIPTDGPPCDYCGDFECPVCRELQPVMTPTLERAILAKLKSLRAENTKLRAECQEWGNIAFALQDGYREALITIADRLEDAGCQCDASDEYVYKCNLCVANDALKSTISTLNPDKV